MQTKPRGSLQAGSSATLTRAAGSSGALRCLSEICRRLTTRRARYCRFYLGRRTDDDERQIGRWSGVAGPKGRWKRALLNKVVASNARWDDAAISPVIRQTLLHWAFEITEADVLAHAK